MKKGSLNAVSALILCGGAGTRLREALPDVPKCLAPVGETTFLGLLLEIIKNQGFQDVVLATGYGAAQVEKYAGDGAGWGLDLKYSCEKEPLGTGGAIRLSFPFLTDPFFVFNGDSYTEFSAEGMMEALDHEAQMVMALARVEDVSRYGCVHVDSNERVTEFVEKGRESGPGWINAGIYLLRKTAFQQTSGAESFSMERDVIPALLPGGISAVYGKGSFLDIGVPEDYRKAEDFFRCLSEIRGSGL